MKRIISLIMVLVLALSLVPTTVWATEVTPADAVASVTYGSGETQKFASSLKDAFEYAAASDVKEPTVTLLKNVTLDESVTIDASKEVTIDGQGNTINVPDGKYIKASENGKLTLNGVTVTGPAYKMSLLYITESAEVTISKDSKVAATSGIQEEYPYPAILIQSNKEFITTYTPQLHVYGAVSAVKMPAIQGNGTDRSTSKIDINDGASVTSGSLAMYLPQPCEVNVNGGTVKGYCAIGIKSGTLNINGGLVQGVANDTKISDEDSSTNGINNDGSAIMIDSYIGYAGHVKINISGGKVESLHSTAIREIGNDACKTNMVSLSVTGGEVMGADGMDAILVRDVTMKAGTLSATGGTFSSNPTEFVDTGKYTVTEENGKFTVNEREYVAQVGADKYYSLEDAINNVQNGQTIELIKDVTDAVGLKVDTHKTFTVDFKGHTYTVNKPGAGSRNTETNAFQLLKDQTITFKNGTINVSKDNLVAASDGRNIKRIIQCYAGLTLEDMLIDGTNVFGNGYPMTFNNQPVYIIGNTSVICNSATTTAFDADGNWGGYDRCKVTIDTTGTIGGDIELGQGYLDIRNVKAERIVLCKRCGETDFENRISVTGGTFSSNPTDYVHDEHYKVSKGLDGMYTVGLKDKDDGTGGKTSVVELPAETTKNTTTATIDVADIDANKELSVVGGDVSVTFDQNAAAGIADAAGNSTKLNLTVEKTEPSAEQEKTYDDKLVNTTHEVVVNVTLTADDGKPVFDAANAGGKATVQVPYQVGLKKADISVYYLNNGKTEKVPFTYDAETGIITMTLEHFSAYLITTATHPSITPVDSNPTYIKGSNKDLGFTTVDLPEKITVKVGDKTLTEGKDYTVSDGKLTLTGAYLETLDYGNYTLKVFDENGNEIAKTSFAKSFAARPAQQPAQSGNKNSTSTKDDVKSAGTGDMGVALYAVSAVLSLTGSAWIVGKKRSK